MSVNSKHVATFLLGAAAALAAYKYYEMTPEEREKLAQKLKDKANKLKDETEDTFEKAKDYFEELKHKGGEYFKEHIADASELLHKIFGGDKGKAESSNG